jgi:probable HAF family extracellular repeat protein
MSITDLGTLPGDAYPVSSATAINDSGQVVGYGDRHAFQWSASGGMQDLGTLPGSTNSYANGINDPDRPLSQGYERLSHRKVSRTDPDATPMAMADQRSVLGYQTHYLIDGGNARIILHALTLSADVMENQPFLDQLRRVLLLASVSTCMLSTHVADWTARQGASAVTRSMWRGKTVVAEDCKSMQ